LKLASLLFIAEEGVLLVLSGIMFEFSKTSTSVERYLFFVFIVLSRCGLYGFEIGEIQILQQTVPEDVRGKVSRYHREREREREREKRRLIWC